MHVEPGNGHGGPAAKDVAVRWWSRRRACGRWRRMPGPVLSAARVPTDTPTARAVFANHRHGAPWIVQQRETGQAIAVGGPWVLAGTWRYLLSRRRYATLLKTAAYRAGMAPISQYGFLIASLSRGECCGMHPFESAAPTIQRLWEDCARCRVLLCTPPSCRGRMLKLAMGERKATWPWQWPWQRP